MLSSFSQKSGGNEFTHDMAKLGTVLINEGNPLPFWFSVEQYRESTEVGTGTQAPYTEDDKEGTRYTTGTTGEKVTLLTTPVYYLDESPVSFDYSSDNPTEINVDPVGNVVYAVPPETTASAVITITGTSEGISVKRTVNITLTLTGSSIIEVIEGGVAGSARKALSDPIDNALTGANPATQQLIYTSQDHVTPAYVRNTNFFLQSTHAEALTCASPWNSTGGNKRAGTAITPRHAVCANHYPIPVGAKLRFIASDNTVVERTVVQASNIIFSNPLYPPRENSNDVWLMLLDSDLPTSIKPCKLFPYDYEAYLPDGATTEGGNSIPLLALDYSENGLVLDYLGKNGPLIPPTPFALYIQPQLPDRLAFYEQVVVGDSGNPIFAAIGSELWLMSTFTGATGGPSYGGLTSELNAMITTLDTLQGDITGHTVTVGDLSSYTNYS
jgi:hypothetical protein